MPDTWDGDSGHVKQATPSLVTALSEATKGELNRDLCWREVLGPAGTGDTMGARLIADSVCWAQLHVGRDSSGRWFSDGDAEFLAWATPLLAARLRDGLRAPWPDDNPAPEPGTIVVDRDLSVITSGRSSAR